MTKWVVSTAAAVVIIAIVITWQAKRCETACEDRQATTSTHPLPNPMIPIVTPPNSNTDQHQPQDQTGRTQPCANRYLCLVLTPANLPNIYLVLVGIGGIIVAIGTLDILERQTAHLRNSVIQARRGAKAARVSAKAAKVSADALVASQRALLDAEFQATEGKWGTWNLVVKNHGATPAQLLRHECSYHPEGQEFKWESNDTKETQDWGTLIAAGQASDPLQTITPDRVFDFFRERGIRGAAGCTIGVILIYKDVINPTVEHKTRFLTLYNRTSKTIQRLSYGNDYT